MHARAFHHLCQSRVGPFPAGRGYDRDTMEELICFARVRGETKVQKILIATQIKSTIPAAAFRIKLREFLLQSGRLTRQMRKSKFPFCVSGGQKNKTKQNIKLALTPANRSNKAKTLTLVSEGLKNWDRLNSIKPQLKRRS